MDQLLSYVPRNDSWYFSVLYYLVAVILIASFLLIAFYVFTVIGNIIASPFNAALSEKTEELIIGASKGTPGGLKMIMKDISHSIGVEIKRLLFFIIWFIPIFLINFIPVIGQVIYFVMMLFYTGYALNFTFMDYSLDRRYKSFREKNRIIFSNKSRMMGFGMICFFIGMIPILNLFLIPVCVIAGTLMFINEHLHKDSIKQ
jgi:CysZ protein